MSQGEPGGKFSPAVRPSAKMHIGYALPKL